jgi:hypothetical protein
MAKTTSKKKLNIPVQKDSLDSKMYQCIHSEFRQPHFQNEIDIYLAKNSKEVSPSHIDSKALILVKNEEHYIIYFVKDGKYIKNDSNVLIVTVCLSAEEEELFSKKTSGKIRRTPKNSAKINDIIKKSADELFFPTLKINQKKIKELKGKYKFSDGYDLFYNLVKLYGNLRSFKNVVMGVPTTYKKKITVGELNYLCENLMDKLENAEQKIKSELAENMRNGTVFLHDLMNSLKILQSNCRRIERKIPTKKPGGATFDSVGRYLGQSLAYIYETGTGISLIAYNNSAGGYKGAFYEFVEDMFKIPEFSQTTKSKSPGLLAKNAIKDSQELREKCERINKQLEKYATSTTDK